MAFQGFAGDGKTFTAAKIAIGLHKVINSKKPIALFDTEKAFKALKPEFDAANIQAVVNDADRSLASLNQAIKWCEDGGADILIIDSITHVWEEFVKAYLNRPGKDGKPLARTRLEFQDWGVIKPRWKEQFSTPYVQAKCHIIFTGRAGYEYTDEKNEDGKREIYKSGIKMKAETETAFEPDILVLMEKKQDLMNAKKRSIWREGLIIKDRTTKIDGMSFKNPSFRNFFPAIKVLLDGTLKEVHGQNIPDTFEEFEQKFGENARERDAILEEIKGCFDIMGLGTGAMDKQVKAWILTQVYGVNSVEFVARKSLPTIREGLKVIQGFGEKYRDYLNACLDAGTDPEKEHVKKLMKEFISEPIKEPA